jgi:hypothetical protein
VSLIDQVSVPKQMIVTQLIMKFIEFDVLWHCCGTTFKTVFLVFAHLSFYRLRSCKRVLPFTDAMPKPDEFGHLGILFDKGNYFSL